MPKRQRTADKKTTAVSPKAKSTQAETIEHPPSPPSAPRKKRKVPRRVSTNTTPPNLLTLSEMRTIKTQITKAIDVPDLADASPPRSDEIYALIEKWVAKGAEIRKAKNVIDEEWFHPEMQKCIRLQVRIYNKYMLLKEIVSQISS